MPHHTPDRESAVDLRTDAMTLPPPGMRDAIACAELGDDVYGEDPTVNRLEALAAEMLGKADGLFTSSGTMTNLLAVMAQCQRGQQVLVGDLSDIWRWEAVGGALAGVIYHPVPTRATGELAIADLEAAADADAVLGTTTGMLCLESTHDLCGGRALSLDYLARAQSFARRRGIALHLDGARFFNAAIALNVTPRSMAGFADTVGFCVSKGLTAPVGSLLVGPSDVIARARRLRKVLGGGMRQAGIIAAAAVYALEHMIDRLVEDHATARQLADGLHGLPGIALETPSPETNIVFWRLADPELRVDTFISTLHENGVRVLEISPGRIRAVTHDGITPEDIARAIASVARTIDRSRVAIAGPAPA